ncbi:MAG: hypothetical protein COA79_24355 [Planctomycetota bacterium]|nr:MAG: hypothetical protein COA79_24355 [Planctomycetota bacterium]
MLSVLPLAHNLEESTIIAEYFNVIVARKTQHDFSKLNKVQEVSKDKPSDVNNINYSNQTSKAPQENVSAVNESSTTKGDVGSKIDVTF